jgi:hypothetical protein
MPTRLSHYPPFGSSIQELQHAYYDAGDTSKYRFGFNTQERDDEIAGEGNVFSAEFWEYDARLGRRWNLDPIFRSWESGYSTFKNNPIYFSDIFGLAGTPTTTKTYTVKSGDSPESIAKQFGVSVWDIAKFNKGKQEGGGEFSSTKNSDGSGMKYSEYWINGKGTLWKIRKGDVLIIPNKEEPISSQINVNTNLIFYIAIYDPYEYLKYTYNQSMTDISVEGARLFSFKGSFQSNESSFFDGSGRSTYSRKLTVNYNIKMSFNVTYTKDINSIPKNTHVVFVNNSGYCSGGEAIGCHFGGIDVINGPSVGSNSGAFASVVLHELGHQFGLNDV